MYNSLESFLCKKSFTKYVYTVFQNLCVFHHLHEIINLQLLIAQAPYVSSRSSNFPINRCSNYQSSSFNTHLNWFHDLNSLFLRRWHLFIMLRPTSRLMDVHGVRIFFFAICARAYQVLIKSLIIELMTYIALWIQESFHLDLIGGNERYEDFSFS